jgi:hypothetical protein
MRRTASRQRAVEFASAKTPDATQRQAPEQHDAVTAGLLTSGVSAYGNARSAHRAHLNLLHLQRAVGNRAIGHLIQAKPIRSRSARPAAVHVQRYISGEHTEAGEAATARKITLDLWVGPPEPFTKTRKVILTYGEANALLGDYYEGWSELKKAPAPEVEQLVSIFKRERAAMAANKPLPTEAEYEQATAGRKSGTGQPGAATKTYLELAKENVAHFAPGNRDLFATQHKQALKRGVEAFDLRAQGKTAEADAAEAEAFLINADADHFMQDAFAAGHLMSKPLIQLATVEFWTAGMGRAAGDNVRAAALKDQTRIWAAIERHVIPTLSTGEALGLRLLARDRAISMVVDQILDRIQGRPDLTANLGAKLVHDHLNRNGVQVFSEDDPTTGWRTFGDNFMSKGVTKNKVVVAQKASVANVESAVKDGLGQVGTKPVDIDAFLKTNNPWRMVPRWAEVPAGTRREVGSALADRSWVHDLLKTLLFKDDPSSPLYLLLLENLELVGGIVAAEEQAATQRHTKQASEADKLLKRFSKNFAKGGKPDDVDEKGLARALRGKPADLFQEVLDRVEPEDKDDNVALEFALFHPTRAKLAALDVPVLLGMAAAMRGGSVYPDEALAIAKIEAALAFKVGQELLGQVPSKERKGGKEVLKAIGAQGERLVAELGKGGDLASSTRKDTWQPKELAADCKGQDPAVLLGVIHSLFLPNYIAAWMTEFAALHTDAELAALDIGVLQAAAEAKTWYESGKQLRRIKKALADAQARGATSTAKPDDAKGAELVKKRLFTSHPKLAGKLKGKSPELIDDALESLGEDGPTVAAEFSKLHTDDELAKVDLGVLQRLAGRVQDPAELARVQKARQSALKDAAARTGL